VKFSDSTNRATFFLYYAELNGLKIQFSTQNFPFSMFIAKIKILKN
jgi:hypothetical protein